MPKKKQKLPKVETIQLKIALAPYAWIMERWGSIAFFAPHIPGDTQPDKSYTGDILLAIKPPKEGEKNKVTDIMGWAKLPVLRFHVTGAVDNAETIAKKYIAFKKWICSRYDGKGILQGEFEEKASGKKKKKYIFMPQAEIIFEPKFHTNVHMEINKLLEEEASLLLRLKEQKEQALANLAKYRTISQVQKELPKISKRPQDKYSRSEPENRPIARKQRISKNEPRKVLMTQDSLLFPLPFEGAPEAYYLTRILDTWNKIPSNQMRGLELPKETKNRQELAFKPVLENSQIVGAIADTPEIEFHIKVEPLIISGSEGMNDRIMQHTSKYLSFAKYKNDGRIVKDSNATWFGNSMLRAMLHLQKFAPLKSTDLQPLNTSEID